jgi:phosphopantetheinyl transferase (holo-ACP synthase)
LSEKLSALEDEKVIASRKQKLDAVIGKLPNNLQKPYSRISSKDMTDDEFNTLITETTAEVEDLAADFAAKGSVLKTPMGGGATKKEPSKEEIAKILDNLI